MKVEFEIKQYDYEWVEIYINEKKKLKQIFGDSLNSIHHIGSTAIPNTNAKPEIDILIVVKDISTLSDYDKPIKKLGYVVRGECLDKGGTPGRFYYCKDVNKKRTHKLHICQIGHPDILRFLLFVKYLNDHEDMAKRYSRLKTELSKNYNYGRDIEKYLAGKSKFISETLEKAFDENKDWQYEDFIMQ